MALSKKDALALKRLENKKKKTEQEIKYWQKLWVKAIDRNFVERHIAKQTEILCDLNKEVQFLRNLQVR